jgi:hypothetical protein
LANQIDNPGVGDFTVTAIGGEFAGGIDSTFLNSITSSGLTTGTRYSTRYTSWLAVSERL